MFAIAVGLALAVVIWTMLGADSKLKRQLEDPSARLLPSREVVDALFNQRDGEFVARLNSPELAQILQGQRRSIALSWLGSIRNEAFAAIREYRTSVRQTDALRVSAELRILYKAGTFLALHLLLSILVRCVSVFRIHGLLRRLHELSEPLLSYAPLSAGVAVSK